MTISPLRRAVLGVFALLWISSAYVWHSRDWNVASRLMLTYALADRGTLTIDGLDAQTNDKAYLAGHYYSDKGPGYSLLALGPYLAARHLLGLPPHPLNEPAQAHGAADYWVTLGTSGLATALTGALLTALAAHYGCRLRLAVLVGLSYGLATPALIYASLAYGHQTTAFCLLTAFALGEFDRSRRSVAGLVLAGGLTASAAVIELSAAPLGVIVTVWCLIRALQATRSFWPVLWFGVGALPPTLLLLGYNSLAFGSPFDLAYRYHVVPRFRSVHNPANPLGLRGPDWSVLTPLLIGQYRGLLFYAPSLLLAPIGLVRGWRAGRVGPVLVASLVLAAALMTNLSYPEWTGGWSTGPRLLVTALPFGFVLVALALAGASRWIAGAAIALALAGAVVALGFNAVGGRIPDALPGSAVARPWTGVVLPLWAGQPLPLWWTGERVARNLGSMAWLALTGQAVTQPALAFLPLVLFQGLGIWLLLRTLARCEAPKNEDLRPQEPRDAATS